MVSSVDLYTRLALRFCRSAPGLSLGGEPRSLWAVAADLLDPVLKRIFDKLRVRVAQVHARIGQLPPTRDEMPIPTDVVASVTLGERTEDIQAPVALRAV